MRAIKIAEWVGTTMSIIGASLMASGHPMIAYPLMGIGAVVLFSVGVISRNAPMWALQGGFLLINFVGIYHWVFKG